MLITGAPTLEELPGEDLHVAGEHGEVDLAGQELEHSRFRVCLAVGVHPNVIVGHAEAGDVTLEVWMVRDDRDHVCVKLATTPAPEEIQHAVLVARGQQRDPLRVGRVGDSPLHRER